MPSTTKTFGSIAALVAAGVVAGGVLAGTMTASAADSTPAATPSASASVQAAAPADPSVSQRSDETLLTGTTLQKVTAAAKAKYPDATVQRVETDSEGVYEAHVVLADGSPAIVQVGSDFAVTGVQTGGPGRV